MKKLFAVMFALIIGVSFVVPEQNAEAQVIYTRKCCDMSGTVRCILDSWTPVGNGCFCYGQGSGTAC